MAIIAIIITIIILPPYVPPQDPSTSLLRDLPENPPQSSEH